MLKPHLEKTIQRISAEKTVLLVQDTSAIMFNKRDVIDGMGVITNNEQQGFLIHPTIAVTPQRVCLGITKFHYWNREKIQEKTEAEIKKREKFDISLKESCRWLNTLKESEAISELCPETNLIAVGDRECDIFEVLNYEGRVKYLTRVAHDRNTYEGKLISDVMQTEPIGTLEFYYPKDKRTVKQNIYTKEVLIRNPKNHKEYSKPITIVICDEINTPEGKDRIRWILATSVHINDEISASDIINWYLCRWEIEILFKILKSGFELEKKQLKSFDRIINITCLFLLTSWRILLMSRLGEACPDIPCSIVFDEYEWKLLFYKINKKEPESVPKLGEMILNLALLGGYLNRKSDSKPGPKVLWQGLNKLYFLVEGWLLSEEYPVKRETKNNKNF